MHWINSCIKGSRAIEGLPLALLKIHNLEKALLQWHEVQPSTVLFNIFISLQVPFTPDLTDRLEAVLGITIHGTIPFAQSLKPQIPP